MPSGPHASTVLAAGLPADLVRALAERGVTIDGGWREADRRFLRAGPWFVTVSDRAADVPVLVFEATCRACVGGEGPLRAPRVHACGPGWYLSARVDAQPLERVPVEVVAVAVHRIASLELPAAPSGGPGAAVQARVTGLAAGLVRRGRLELGPVPAADRRLARRIIAEPAPSVTVHGDLHPGNVLATEEALYVLDWETSGRGPAGLDVAQLAALMEPAAGAAVLARFAELPDAPSMERLARLRYACTVQAAANLLLATVAEGRDEPRALALVAQLPGLRPGS